MLAPAPVVSPQVLTSPTSLTLPQRVQAGAGVLRAYASKFALACIRKQRKGTCPPAEVESLRWLLYALEALCLPEPAAATLALAAPSLPATTARRYHLYTAQASCGCASACCCHFGLHAKFDLLLEASRRYPLLAGALNPYCLFHAPVEEPMTEPAASLTIISVLGSDALDIITVLGSDGLTIVTVLGSDWLAIKVKGTEPVPPEILATF